MLSDSEIRLSKAIARLNEAPVALALQTRACFVPPEFLADETDLRNALGEIQARGYNTVLIPAFFEGESLFQTRRSGRLRGGRCPGHLALSITREYPFSVWLLVDFLAAGVPGTGKLGELARANGEWLMRDYQGNHQFDAGGGAPGLFCWTSVEYRRYLGNLLAELVDGYPVDGLFFDFRSFPESGDTPETWSHLGYSSLRRIQAELGLDLEAFLTNPTTDQFRAMERWRQGQLEHFVESICARVQEERFELVTGLLVSAEAVAPNAPWMPLYRRGVASEVALIVSPDGIADGVRDLDLAATGERPFLVAVEKEEGIVALGPPLRDIPATGFLVLEPDFETRRPLPPPDMFWTMTGALESDPIAAAATIMTTLTTRIDRADPVLLFFDELGEFLALDDPRDVTFKDIFKVRGDVQLIADQIAQDTEGSAEGRRVIVHELNRVARLLMLAPAQPIQY